MRLHNKSAGASTPKKAHYFVGEPVIVDLEILNGTDRVIEIGTGDCPGLDPQQFEVNGASPPKQLGLYTCEPGGIAGSCIGSIITIPVGGKYLKRVLLDGPFQIDSPGLYHVGARREQGVLNNGEIVANLKVDSKFAVDIQPPQAGELEAAYRPFLNDLNANDLGAKYFAASAVTQNPPSFAETAILALANDAQIPGASIGGLQRLATVAARAKLLEMSSKSAPEGIQQAAMRAIAEIQNPEDCEAMLDIANRGQQYTQQQAYIASARVCRQKAIPALLPLLSSSDPQLLMYLAIAFENTRSKQAVAPLITLLVNTDVSVRRAAEESLATLTHRRSRYGIADLIAATRSFDEWSKWWASNSNSTNIYGTDACSESLPLR